METYKFLIDLDNNNGTYFAIPEDRIVTMKVTDTFNEWGQLVSPHDTGAHMTLISIDAVNAANEEYKWDTDEDGDFCLNSVISAYDTPSMYQTILQECKEDVDYVIEVETCTGFDYYDGTKHKSIILSYEHNDYPVQWMLLDDKELEFKLNKSIENMIHLANVRGEEVYDSKDYVIIKSHYATNWATYELTEK